jgi:hypothetical protein
MLEVEHKELLYLEFVCEYCQFHLSEIKRTIVVEKSQMHRLRFRQRCSCGGHDKERACHPLRTSGSQQSPHSSKRREESKMVGGTGKQPQRKLTEQEQRLCREALLSDRHARRLRRAASKTKSRGADGQRQKKRSRKEGAKCTTAAMAVRGPLESAAGIEKGAEAEAKEQVERVEDAAEEKEVAAEGAGGAAVEDVAGSASPTTNRRKRRRAIFEGVSDDGESSCDEDGADAELPSVPPQCVVQGDANRMDAAADACTYLNSDEDLLVEEDQESCDDDVESDWDIGELTDDDSDEDGGEDLPASVCSSLAQNKTAVSMMRTHGWEYGTLRCSYTTYVEIMLSSYNIRAITI